MSPRSRSARSRTVAGPKAALGALLVLGALAGLFVFLSRSAQQSRAARAELDVIPLAPIRPMP